MRLADISDWFALRPHLIHPWAFLRLRKRARADLSALDVCGC